MTGVITESELRLSTSLRNSWSPSVLAVSETLHSSECRVRTSLYGLWMCSIIFTDFIAPCASTLHVTAGKSAGVCEYGERLCCQWAIKTYAHTWFKASAAKLRNYCYSLRNSPEERSSCMHLRPPYWLASYLIQKGITIVQGGSNMTGTDLCVNKPHCAAAVRPWESEATTATLLPARIRTCLVLSGSC